MQFSCGCKDGGCNFWEWLDPKPTEHQIKILVDLRDAVKALHKKNKSLEVENSELAYLVDEAHAKYVVLVKEKEELVKEKEEAKALVKEKEEAKALVKVCCHSVKVLAVALAVCLALLVATCSKGPQPRPMMLQLL